VGAEDIFEELDKYGEIENLNICDNLADHMVGSVYAKFKDENDAARAMQV
jgi:splicing factor U2AF subunit